jgi:hypothetical protein
LTLVFRILAEDLRYHRRVVVQQSYVDCCIFSRERILALAIEDEELMAIEDGELIVSLAIPA